MPITLVWRDPERVFSFASFPMFMPLETAAADVAMRAQTSILMCCTCGLCDGPADAARPTEGPQPVTACARWPVTTHLGWIQSLHVSVEGALLHDGRDRGTGTQASHL